MLLKIIDAKNNGALRSPYTTENRWLSSVFAIIRASSMKMKGMLSQAPLGREKLTPSPRFFAQFGDIESRCAIEIHGIRTSLAICAAMRD